MRYPTTEPNMAMKYHSFKSGSSQISSLVRTWYRKLYFLTFTTVIYTKGFPSLSHSPAGSLLEMTKCWKSRLGIIRDIFARRLEHEPGATETLYWSAEVETANSRRDDFDYVIFKWLLLYIINIAGPPWTTLHAIVNTIRAGDRAGHSIRHIHKDNLTCGELFGQ